MIAVIKNDTSLVATPMPSTPRPRPWRYITEGVPSFFVSVIKPITDHNRATTTDNENGHCLIGIALHSITGNPLYLWLFLMSHLLQELSATSKPLQQWFRCPEEPQEPFQPPPGLLTELSGPMPMVRSNQVPNVNNSHKYYVLDQPLVIIYIHSLWERDYVIYDVSHNKINKSIKITQS